MLQRSILITNTHTHSISSASVLLSCSNSPSWPSRSRGLVTLLRVCVAFLLGVCVAVLLEFTELATPVEMPRLCCNTHPDSVAVCASCLAWSCHKRVRKSVEARTPLQTLRRCGSLCRCPRSASRRPMFTSRISTRCSLSLSVTHWRTLAPLKKVWQTLSIGKSSKIPHNLIISGAVHGQMPGHCLGVVCQTLPVLRYYRRAAATTETVIGKPSNGRDTPGREWPAIVFTPLPPQPLSTSPCAVSTRSCAVSTRCSLLRSVSVCPDRAGCEPSSFSVLFQSKRPHVPHLGLHADRRLEPLCTIPVHSTIPVHC